MRQGCWLSSLLYILDPLLLGMGAVFSEVFSFADDITVFVSCFRDIERMTETYTLIGTMMPSTFCGTDRPFQIRNVWFGSVLQLGKLKHQLTIGFKRNCSSSVKQIFYQLILPLPANRLKALRCIVLVYSS